MYDKEEIIRLLELDLEEEWAEDVEASMLAAEECFERVGLPKVRGGEDTVARAVWLDRLSGSVEIDQGYYRTHQSHNYIPKKHTSWKDGSKLDKQWGNRPVIERRGHDAIPDVDWERDVQANIAAAIAAFKRGGFRG